MNDAQATTKYSELIDHILAASHEVVKSARQLNENVTDEKSYWLAHGHPMIGQAGERKLVQPTLAHMSQVDDGPYLDLDNKKGSTRDYQAPPPQQPGVSIFANPTQTYTPGKGGKGGKGQPYEPSERQIALGIDPEIDRMGNYPPFARPIDPQPKYPKKMRYDGTPVPGFWFSNSEDGKYEFWFNDKKDHKTEVKNKLVPRVKKKSRTHRWLVGAAY